MLSSPARGGAVARPRLRARRGAPRRPRRRHLPPPKRHDATQGADQASASSGDEAAFVEALNRIRADVDLPALTVNHQLSDLARIHTEHMAGAGEIAHATPISAGYEGPWTKLGENVGVGAEVEDLVDAFVASPGHYANIVDPAFTEIGVGVVRRSDALYTTHRFLEPPVDADS